MKRKISLLGLVAIAALFAAVILGSTSAGAQKKPPIPPPPLADPAIAYVAVYQNQRDLMVMNADGSNQRAVVSEKMVENIKPDWSPTGTQLMFNRNKLKGGNSGIYIVNVDGTGLTKVVDFNSSSYIWKGAWSPVPLGDGHYKIAFSDRAKLANGTLKADFDLFLINLDGTGRVQLTDTPGVHEWDVDWSPSGDRIAVVTYNPTTQASDLVVYSIQCDAGGCTASPLGSVISSGEISSATSGFDWAKASPDNLVVSAPKVIGLAYDLWIINVLSPYSPPVQLTQTPNLTEWDPSWSSDDSKILFMSGGGIWVMNSDGTGAAKRIAAPQLGIKLFEDPNWRR